MQYSDFLTKTETQLRTVTGELMRGDIVVLNYSISYPELKSNLKTAAARYINARYTEFSNQVKKNIMATYYPRACTYYKNMTSADFTPLKIMCEMCVMYENRGYLSLFFDTYEQLGELNLANIRHSNTWYVNSGELCSLQSFFVQGSGYKKIIYDHICACIRAELAKNEHVYFSDWQEILPYRLDLSRYYLADDGFVVYFPEYKIAPKSTGLPSFLVPYTAFGSRLKYDL